MPSLVNVFSGLMQLRTQHIEQLKKQDQIIFTLKQQLLEALQTSSLSTHGKSEAKSLMGTPKKSASRTQDLYPPSDNIKHECVSDSYSQVVAAKNSLKDKNKHTPRRKNGSQRTPLSVTSPPSGSTEEPSCEIRQRDHLLEASTTLETSSTQTPHEIKNKSQSKSYPSQQPSVREEAVALPPTSSERKSLKESIKASASTVDSSATRLALQHTRKQRYHSTTHHDSHKSTSKAPCGKSRAPSKSGRVESFPPLLQLLPSSL